MMGEHPQLRSAGMSDENVDCKKEKKAGWCSSVKSSWKNPAKISDEASVALEVAFCDATRVL
jgi:hypothetical protein